jgi:membrane protein implicated in regulation of membrane protease activity
MIWQTFALVFAAAGFALNLHFFDTGGPPLYSLAWTLPTASVAGYLGVALVARVLGPVLSSKEQEATSRSQLIGQTGVVISTKVDAEFGEVRIRDKSGHDLRVVCKLAPGAKAMPMEHQSVLVVDYTEDKGELLVEPLDLEEDAVKSARRRA